MLLAHIFSRPFDSCIAAHAPAIDCFSWFVHQINSTRLRTDFITTYGALWLQAFALPNNRPHRMQMICVFVYRPKYVANQYACVGWRRDWIGGMNRWFGANVGRMLATVSIGFGCNREVDWFIFGCQMEMTIWYFDSRKLCDGLFFNLYYIWNVIYLWND